MLFFATIWGKVFFLGGGLIHGFFCCYRVVTAGRFRIVDTKDNEVFLNQDLCGHGSYGYRDRRRCHLSSGFCGGFMVF